MQALILAIVKPLVDHPNDIEVKVVEEERRITYHLSVHKEDMGKVIGRQGRVAKAIRTVVYAAAGLPQQKKVYVEIVE